MVKQVAKDNRRMQRQAEERRKDRRMRLLFWGTGVVFIGLVVLAVIFQPKDKGTVVDYNILPRLGQADAPVKIVEFGDYKCPTCKMFTEQMEPRLKKDYIDTGKVAFYFANFTIIGPDSKTAALAGQAAYHQNNEAFWKFKEAVYKNQADEQTQWATPEALVEIARKENVPLDYKKLLQDIQSQTYAKEVAKHFEWATSANMTGTPTLLINGQKFVDIFEYSKLQAAIDKALGDAK